ncbi:MAG: sigma-70 family RNA polymerase sigma factor, partial [Bacteroidota bacterium]
NKYSQMTDHELLSLIRSSNREAEEEFWKRKSKLILLASVNKARNMQDAQEIAQITTFKLIPSLRRRTVNNVDGYIWESVKNNTADYYKKKSRSPEVYLDNESVHSIPTAHSHKIQGDASTVFSYEKMTQHLNPNQKQILDKRIKDNHSYDAIARDSEKTVESIRETCRRALRNVRRFVKGH